MAIDARRTTRTQTTNSNASLARASTSFLRNASLLSTARLFAQDKLKFKRGINLDRSIAGRGSGMTRSLTALLVPRQQQDNGGGGGGGASSQSLTFGFAFMAILLTLLFLAHLMQRVANRRQAEVLARMAALQEARDCLEVPKLWDVHVGIGQRGLGSASDSKVVDSDRLRWKDIQPLSAHATPPSIRDGQPSSAGPHDRPICVSIIVAMPVSPFPFRVTRRDSGKWVKGRDHDHDNDSDRPPPYYELGVATVN